MADNVIKIKKNENILRLNIVTEEGNKTGEYLEFNLGDIELPLRYQELVEKDKKNKEWLRNQFLIIEKRQDVKGKELLSKNDKDKLKALNEYIKKEVDVYNMFLGENGVEKLLNGQKITWDTLVDVDNIISEQIAPYINVNMETIAQKIKDKYSQAVAKSKEVLK